MAVELLIPMLALWECVNMMNIAMKATFNHNLFCTMLACLFVTTTLMTPQVHGFQSTPAASPTVQPDDCCIDQLAIQFISSCTDDTSESPVPCCPDSEDGDTGCLCHCCEKGITAVPVFIATSTKSIFDNVTQFLVIIPEARPEHVSLGVEIEPPIA